MSSNNKKLIKSKVLKVAVPLGVLNNGKPTMMNVKFNVTSQLVGQSRNNNSSQTSLQMNKTNPFNMLPVAEVSTTVGNRVNKIANGAATKSPVLRLTKNKKN